MKTFAVAFLSGVLAMPLLAQKDANARLKAATEDLQEMMNA